MFQGIPRKAIAFLAVSYILINTNMSFFWSLFRVFVFKEGASFTEIALISVINSLSSIILSPLFGALSDELGKRKIFLVLSSILIAALSPIYALLHSPIEFIVLYAISTIAMSMMTPVLNAILSEISSTETRGRTIGAFYGIASISWVFSGVIGGYLLETLGHGFTFVFIGILCLIGGLLLSYFYKEHNKSSTQFKIAIKRALEKQKKSLGFIHVNPKLRIIILSVLFHGAGTGIAFTLFTIKLFIAVKESFVVYGIISGLSGILSIFAPVIYGYLGDKYGKKHVMIATLFAYSAYFIMIGKIWDPFLLTILWAIPLWPGIRISTVALVADISKEEEFGYSQGQIVSAMALARAIGALLGGITADMMSARTNLQALDFIIMMTSIAPFVAAIILTKLKGVR